MPSKTLKSNPVMESHISRFDGSRRSHSWTLVSSFDTSRRRHSWTVVENEYASLLLWEEGKIDGGYFLDDIHPLFFHVGGSCGLSSGPIDFLGMIGDKTAWTAEDCLDLEYDCDLVGFGGLDDDHGHDGDVAVVGFDGLEDGVDIVGFNNILGLSQTTIGYNFVFINGEDCISGFVQFMGKNRPTLKFIKGLEMIFTELIFRPPKVKHIQMKIPGLSGGSGPVSIPTKIRLKASWVPRRLVSLEAVRIPVLLSYSSNDGDLELYVPTFHASVVRPPVAVNFSRYVMLSHNYRDCEILLLHRCRREIIVYRGLDNTVVNLPYIQDFHRDCRGVSGRFQKVVLGRGQSDYRVFVIAFHRIHQLVGTRLRLYYRQPFQQVWNLREYLMPTPNQRPLAFLVIGEFFAWVDIVSGTMFTIRNWDIDPAEGVPVLGPVIVLPGEFAGARCVFSVEDEERTCVVVHHHDMLSVYEISIFNVLLPGWGNQLDYNLVKRVNLSNRNFYCSAFCIGFSAAPLHLGAGPINAIFVGGHIGDCSRLNNYAEIVAQQNAGLQVVDVDIECLRHCHDPRDAARPLLCRCQSAFLLLPMHLVARMIPDLAPFIR